MTVSSGNHPNGTAIVFYVNLMNYAHKHIGHEPFKHINEYIYEHFHPKHVIRGSLYHTKKDANLRKSALCIVTCNRAESYICHAMHRCVRRHVNLFTC